MQKCNLEPNGVVAEWIAGSILSVWFWKCNIRKKMCIRLVAMQKCNLEPNSVVAKWIARAILSVWLM